MKTIANLKKDCNNDSQSIDNTKKTIVNKSIHGYLRNKSMPSQLPGIIRTSAFILAMIMISTIFISCNKSAQVSPGMKVDSRGVEFASTLSSQIPYRKAYSEQEKSAAALIVAELEKMGYKPQVNTFGTGKKISQNIIVRIPGRGFKIAESQAGSTTSDELVRKQVIVGVHYDCAVGVEEKATYPDYDGIQENASGVGALISIAKELDGVNNGYDVILAFFGAGNDKYAGAAAFLASMTKEEIAATDAMYGIESIYAGDKLYSHAGINSTITGSKYEKRRKLYELSDVAIANSIDIRFNESDLDIDVNGDNKKEVYREITINKSDYSVFDAVNIPCVFIESYDYFAGSQTEQMESKNPAFGSTKGKIRGTNFDSTKKLAEVLEKDRLETRVKNTAFLIVKAIEKGMYRAEPNPTIINKTSSSSSR